MIVATKPVFATRVGSGESVAGVRQVSTKQCIVASLRVFNSGTAAYLHVFDSVSTPVNGAVPTYLIGKIPTDTGFESSTPISCANGCFIGLSSTAFTYTAQASSAAITAECV